MFRKTKWNFNIKNKKKKNNMVSTEFSSGREQSCSGVLMNGPTIQQRNKITHGGSKENAQTGPVPARQ